MKRFKEDTVLFSIGSILYSLIEIAWRGFTHWSMGITGGLCMVILYRIEEIFGKQNLVKKCVLGSVIITTLEFVVGCIVNIRCRWAVWDYSTMPLNLMGQICVPFTFLWFLLCITVFNLCEKLKTKVIVKIK